MKITKKIVCLLLITAILLAGIASIGIVMLITGKTNVGTEEQSNSDSEEQLNAPIYPTISLTTTSFFEDQFQEIDPAVGESINPTYDTLPAAQNTTNLQSLGTATYANINGKTVTADAYYRLMDEALNNPNAGMGILLYQCIQYKIKNPDADVELCFSSYRTSPTTAVCVLPESRYYGYMRALYGEGNDYDQNGFVRIAYMLVEAAKMGIDVTIIGQLNSYGVKQYNAEGNLVKVQESSYIEYFQNGLTQDCYAKYAEGKKVSDFMTFRPVEWSLSDKGGCDMMHVKMLTASHYLATDGTEHENAVFLSSSNLDAIDYRGCNGHNGTQSGVIVTGHDKIYTVAVNYAKLMAKYYEQSALYEMRNLINERNNAQAALILAGREAEIPEDEQIIYLGSESDKVFKMYFTPLAGDYDEWNPDINPYVEHTQNLYDSSINYPNEYLIYTINCPNYTRTFNVSQTMADMVSLAFNNTKNPENRICVQANGYDHSSLNDLVVGKDIGFAYLRDGAVDPHSKDMLFSYIKDDARQYVSLLSSCNFHSGALYYQTNSMLTITENDETGDVFFKTFGKASTQGAVVDDGETFSENERIYMSKEVPSLPQTFEATFELNPGTANNSGNYGMLLSNHDYWHSQVSYEIVAKGHPQVTFWVRDENASVKKYVFLFDQVNVLSHAETHLTLVHDREAAEMRCYINGELKQTITQESISKGSTPLSDYDTKFNFVVGGNWLGSNGEHFTGVLNNLAIWSDVRTADEILADSTSQLADREDDQLMAAYNFRKNSASRRSDYSKNQNNLKTEALWINVSDMAPVEDFAYSFAVIGDVQELSEDYFNDHYLSDKTDGDPYDDIYTDEDTNPSDNKPEYLSMMYDWLLNNKEKHKIEYVMGLGDVTQKSYTAEWDYAKQQYYRLNGVIPFSIARGNHDKVEPQIRTKLNGKTYYDPALQSNALFYKTFDDEIYNSQIDGKFKDGDVANTYNAFTVGGTKYLLICLDYGASDEVLAWAAGLIESHADHRVIITTHTYLFRDGTTLDRNDAYPASKSQGGENDGNDMWDELISKYENIVLVMSGHDPWDHIICTRTEGDNGNIVTQLLIDPQSMDAKLDDCTGMIALLYFSEDGNTVTVRYYSVTRNQYGSANSQFSFTISQ